MLIMKKGSTVAVKGEGAEEEKKVEAQIGRWVLAGYLVAKRNFGGFIVSDRSGLFKDALHDVQSALV